MFSVVVKPHPKVHFEVTSVEVHFISIPVDKHEIAPHEIPGVSIENLTVKHIELAKGGGDRNTNEHIGELPLFIERVRGSQSTGHDVGSVNPAREGRFVAFTVEGAAPASTVELANPRSEKGVGWVAEPSNRLTVVALLEFQVKLVS